jgi:hypothetical protein
VRKSEVNAFPRFDVLRTDRSRFQHFSLNGLIGLPSRAQNTGAATAEQ